KPMIAWSVSPQDRRSSIRLRRPEGRPPIMMVSIAFSRSCFTRPPSGLGGPATIRPAVVTPGKCDGQIRGSDIPVEWVAVKVHLDRHRKHHRAAHAAAHGKPKDARSQRTFKCQGWRGGECKESALRIKDYITVQCCHFQPAAER